MLLLLGILVYTLISVFFVLNNMGKKFRKGRWYDWPLTLPTVCIAYIVGYIAGRYSLLKSKYER